MAADYRFVTYETLDEGTIARIMLNRPDQRNAQQRGLLVELNEAFLAAEADDRVRVVILGGNGPMFSSGHEAMTTACAPRGPRSRTPSAIWARYRSLSDRFRTQVALHDLGSKQSMAERAPGPDQHPSFQVNGATREAAEKLMLQEWHHFFQSTRRWRDLRKITVAQVHGDVYATALMLMWACDLIVAADDTRFADVVGTRLGMCDVEYFAHPWEFGARKTKELMLTGETLSVDEAYQLGMVSKVFPAAELSDRAVEFARRIAKVPTMAALLVKESVNQTQDNLGFHNSLNACFTLHQLNHSHWSQLHGGGFPVAGESDGVPNWREAPPVVPSVRDEVKADD